MDDEKEEGEIDIEGEGNSQDEDKEESKTSDEDKKCKAKPRMKIKSVKSLVKRKNMRNRMRNWMKKTLLEMKRNSRHGKSITREASVRISQTVCLCSSATTSRTSSEDARRRGWQFSMHRRYVELKPAWIHQLWTKQEEDATTKSQAWVETHSSKSSGSSRRRHTWEAEDVDVMRKEFLEFDMCPTKSTIRQKFLTVPKLEEIQKL